MRHSSGYDTFLAASEQGSLLDGASSASVVVAPSMPESETAFIDLGGIRLSATPAPADALNSPSHTSPDSGTLPAKLDTKQAPKLAPDLSNMQEVVLHGLKSSPGRLSQLEPADALCFAADALFDNYVAHGQPEILTRATFFYHMALDLTTHGHARRQRVLTQLGACSIAEAAHTRDGDTVTFALCCLREAVQMDPRSAAALEYLGTAYLTRYQVGGDAADLDVAIRLCRRALALRARDDVGRPSNLTNLASVLTLEFHRTGAPGVVDEAIALLREAIGLKKSIAAPGLLLSLHSLARALRDRFSVHGRQEDLDEAIQLSRDVVDMCAEDDVYHQHTAFFIALGDFLRLRFQRAGKAADLEEAVPVYERAVQVCVPDDPRRLTTLLKLSNTVDLLSEDEPRDCAFLEEALKLSQEERMGASPEGRSGLDMLDVIMIRRWKSHRNLDDLDVAISVLRRSVKVRGTVCRELQFPVFRLAIALYSRYGEKGAMKDLEEAILLYRQALSLFEKNEWGYPAALNNLAGALSSRHKQLCAAEDLHDAVTLLKEAYQLCPPGHSNHAFASINFAYILGERAQQRGSVSMSTLGRASDLYRAALALCPPGHLNRADALYGLANVLQAKHDMIQSFSFLDHINPYARWLEESWHDLDQIIAYHTEALELRGGDDPGRSSSLMSLGHAYHARSKRRYDSEDPDTVIAKQLMTEALKKMPPGDPFRAQCQFQLGALNARGPQGSLALAMNLFLEAVKDPHCSPPARLATAMQFLEVIEVYGPPLEHAHMLLLPAYLETVRLLPRVAYSGLDIRSRLRELHKSESLALRGATHALAVARPALAVEMLEEGRGLFWTQALRLRTPFDRIPTPLAQRLAELSRRLEAEGYDTAGPAACFRGLGQEAVSMPSAAKMERDRDAARRREQSEEFDQLLDDVRAQPGLGRFLLPESFSSLAKVAERGPVVILMASPAVQESVMPAVCEAIVITTAGAASQLRFPGVTTLVLKEWNELLKGYNSRQRDVVEEGEPEEAEDAEDEEEAKEEEDEYTTCDAGEPRMLRKVYSRGPGAREVLRALWDHVVSHVIEALGLKVATGRERPRLWWCPTGQFTFLPIHAAGRYQKPGDAVSDYVVSSYTPTLAALLNARRNSAPVPRESARLLLSAVPRPYRGSKLPCTVEEAHVVKAAVLAHALIPEFSGQDPSVDLATTAQGMLHALPGATILHLASHGYQDPRNALRSGFFMSDNILTVEKLMPLPLPRAFFAFLSACETAKGDDKQPDQTVHLAATMLFVGFKSVVGTMWSMSDVDGPVVAKAIYEELFAGDSVYLDPDVIPYALDDAVQKLRARGVHPSRWAPYIHLGI